jgi:uncharacterized membrane protein
VGAVVVSLSLAGTADVLRISLPSARQQMFTASDQEIGRTVRTATKPDAVFLTSQSSINPFAALGGRRIVMGYGGWLWSWGLPYQQREADVARMFEGDQDTEELLGLYRVDYVVIGPSERNQQLPYCWPWRD